ncbi:MAG: ribonuclease J [Pseudothermotoga sp.]
MKIEVLDGFDCIGGNKILVIDNSNDGFLLDFGLNFAKWSLYFEEYLKPRTGKILHDLLKLELLPRIDIYRKDLEPPEFEKDKRIHFLFLSHGHEDHAGFNGLVSEEIPLLTTNETLAILRTNAEIKQQVWNELYLRKRQRSQEDGIYRTDVLKAERNTFIKRKICIKNLSKTSCSLDPDYFIHLDMEELWKDRLYVLGVYHSVIGASGLVAKVDDWWVAYTGDFRTGPDTKEEESFWAENLGENRLELSMRTNSFFQFLKDKHPLLLITEGTTVSREDGSQGSEKDVYQKALEVVQKTNKLVIVDFSVKHLERMMSFLKIALRTDRLLVLMPKDYAYLVKMGEVEPIWKLSDDETKHIRVFHTAKSSFVGLEKDIVEQAKISGILLSPDSINLRPSNYMISAGYWDFHNILDLDEEVLKGSIYIHSSSEAYTEEQQMDFLRFANWTRKFSIQTHGFEVTGDGQVLFNKQFHASGHVGAEKLEELINDLNPEFILPVHTTDRGWFVKRWGKKVITQNLFYL